MTNPLLVEPHNFTRGDAVIVVDRTSTYLSYVGQIYAIVNKPENEYMKPTRLIDYFYIQFPEPFKKSLQTLINIYTIYKQFHVTNNVLFVKFA